MKMSRSIPGAAAVVLMMIGVACGQTLPDHTWRIVGPYSHNNLTIFVVRGPDAIAGQKILTLDEALEKDLVTVYETGNVGELEVENNSAFPIYIQSGCIVKGGRQDRMVRNDIVVAAKSGRLPLLSFCVEQGRWTGRGNESDTSFETSTKLAPSTELKVAAKVKESQYEVWSNVADLQDKLAPSLRDGRAADIRSPSSLQLTLENDELEELTQQHIRAIMRHIDIGGDAIGMVYAINGKIYNADLYGSSDLFRELYPKLLQAATTEAVANLSKDQTAPKIDLQSVTKWLATTDSKSPKVQMVGDNLVLKTYEFDDKISFETYGSKDAQRWIHKNVIRRTN